MNETIIKNPLINKIKNSILNSKERLNLAVPFLSSYANKLFDKNVISEIVDKRIITRFDDSSLASFDLKTLKTLLDLGFTIQYDNSIHLKLYIVDKEVYVTSSNLTKAGFESNIELTVKCDSMNTQNCIDVFNEIWSNCSENKITFDLIDENWNKYELVRKREEYVKSELKSLETTPIKLGQLDLQKITEEIFNQNIDYNQTDKLVYEANIKREKTKEKLKNGFNSSIFYVPKNHELRRDNVFYDLLYGCEVVLAGTGLWEFQYKTVFEHPHFEQVINYIYPDMIGGKPWNLGDKSEFQEFCNGIFDYDIPQYSEAIPIRLASYFYPDFFIPIFKLDHLKKVCETLGLKTNAKTRGDRLFAYNYFLADRMKAISCDNYKKSYISYLIYFTIELYNRFNNGETYNSIIDSYEQNWKKEMIKSGKDLLTKLKIIE